MSYEPDQYRSAEDRAADRQARGEAWLTYCKAILRGEIRTDCNGNPIDTIPDMSRPSRANP